MTIQTGTGKHLVGLHGTTEIMKTRVDGCRMARCIMAALTKLRNAMVQEFPVIASVSGMTGLTIFFDGRMFPEIGAAFFGMALVA